MELVQNTLSWPTFFWTSLVIVLLWLLTTRTQIGRNIIARETRWTVSQWSKLLLVVIITLFILVNPIFHLIAVAIVGILYYLIVGDGMVKSNILRGKDSDTTLPLNIGLGVTPTAERTLLCIPQDMPSVLEEKKALYKSLFSFPYIKDDPYPSIQYLYGEYHVTVRLTSEKYWASLIEYLQHAGFDTTVKTTT